MRDLTVGRLTLPASLLSAKFSRSGGPGGQNVNKVASKAEVRFDLPAAGEFFTEAAYARVKERLANRLDAVGNVLIVASEHRDQARNVEAALVRLEELISQAMTPPKARRATKPTLGSKLRRLDDKKRRSKAKQNRSIPGD